MNNLVQALNDPNTIAGANTAIRQLIERARRFILTEPNDEWQTSSRYIMVEAFAQIDKEEIDPILSITTNAA